MSKISLDTMTRLRNKAAQELSVKLKRMPKEDEITMQVCKWIADAYTPSAYKEEPSEIDMVSLGYWNPKEKE